ncbi:MAG: hypothetical protein ACPGWR_19290 [Ardenticatenaceae bacterium]
MDNTPRARQPIKHALEVVPPIGLIVFYIGVLKGREDFRIAKALSPLFVFSPNGKRYPQLMPAPLRRGGLGAKRTGISRIAPTPSAPPEAPRE